MESVKMLKGIAIGLLCLSVPVLIWLNIYDYQQIRKVLQGRSGARSSDNEPADKTPGKGTILSKSTDQVPASRGNQISDHEAKDLIDQIAAAKEELAMVNRQFLDGAVTETVYHQAASAEAKAEMEREYQENKKRRENPDFQRLQRKEQMEHYGLLFADLFKKLNLSYDKQEKFKEIMVDRDMAPSRGEATSSLEEEYEAKMADLLGDDYKKYQAYMDSRTERNFITKFEQSLGFDEILTGTQRESLIEAIYEDVKNIKYTPRKGTQTQSEKYAQQLDYLSHLHEAFIKTARGILSASQLEQYEGYLKKERDNTELYFDNALLRSETQMTGKRDDDEKSE